MSLFDFMQFATMTEQLKQQEKERKIEELNWKKAFGSISDYEYEIEKYKIEQDI